MRTVTLPSVPLNKHSASSIVMPSIGFSPLTVIQQRKLAIGTFRFFLINLTQIQPGKRLSGFGMFRPKHPEALYDKRTAIHVLVCLIGQTTFSNQINRTFLVAVPIEHHYVIDLIMIYLHGRHGTCPFGRSVIKPRQGKEEKLVEQLSSTQCLGCFVPVTIFAAPIYNKPIAA